MLGISNEGARKALVFRSSPNEPRRCRFVIIQPVVYGHCVFTIPFIGIALTLPFSDDFVSFLLVRAGTCGESGNRGGLRSHHSVDLALSERPEGVRRTNRDLCNNPELYTSYVAMHIPFHHKGPVRREGAPELPSVAVRSIDYSIGMHC